jgi:hypothetical protein
MKSKSQEGRRTMKESNFIKMALMFCLASLTSLPARSQEQAGPAITVYTDNLGMVREVRTFSLKSGVNELRLIDLPAQLDPTSVKIGPLRSTGRFAVAEQSFSYDLVSDARLLERYINKRIKITTRDGKVLTGVLLSGVKKEVGDSSRYRLGREVSLFNPTNQPVIDYSYQNLVLAKDPEKGPVVIVQRDNNIREIELPMSLEDLVVRPTLRARLVSEEEGSFPCEINYQTRGLSWRVDYNLVVAGDSKSADLTGWATISNTSGTDYRGTVIRLMAHDIKPDRSGRRLRVYKYGSPDPELAKESTEGLPVADYHLYPLAATTTLTNNETKQVQLLSSSALSVTRTYVYDGVQIVEGYGDARREAMDAGYGTQSTNKIGIYLEMPNKGQGLARPLPRGKFRVYRRDSDGRPELIGEDYIDHTPAGEGVRLRLGYDFDITGSRRQMEFKVISPSSPTYGGGVYDESIEASVHNHKKETVEVRIVEHLYRWTDWEILEKSAAFEKLDAQTIEFKVQLSPEEEKKISYKVRYRF